MAICRAQVEDDDELKPINVTEVSQLVQGFLDLKQFTNITKCEMDQEQFFFMEDIQDGAKEMLESDDIAGGYISVTQFLAGFFTFLEQCDPMPDEYEDIIEIYKDKYEQIMDLNSEFANNQTLQSYAKKIDNMYQNK